MEITSPSLKLFVRISATLAKEKSNFTRGGKERKDAADLSLSHRNKMTICKYRIGFCNLC